MPETPVGLRETSASCEIPNVGKQQPGNVTRAEDQMPVATLRASAFPERDPSISLPIQPQFPLPHYPFSILSSKSR